MGQVPLCEDLTIGVLQRGEKCWSDCGKEGMENCRERVLVTPDEGELTMIRHPACISKVECVGRVRRTLCEAVLKDDVETEAVEERMPGLFAWALAPPGRAKIRRNERAKLS